MDLACSVEKKESSLQRVTRRLLIPDLAMMLAVFTLFLCLFVFQGTQTLFRDSDTGWHIRTGERILHGSGFPRTDPYSLTRAGQPWMAWEWLSDCAMGAAHLAAGLTGVAFLYGATLALCTWLWLQLNWAAGGNFFIAAAFAPLMLSASNLHWLARPHLFSWAFLLALAIYAERATPEWRWWHPVLAVAFGALWANVHASFFIGTIILWLYSLGHVLRGVLFDEIARYSKARKLAFLGAAGFAGSFLNPYGIELHKHIFHYLTNQQLLSKVGEFQSFNFHDSEAGYILAMVMTTAVGCALCLSQRELSRFIVGFVILAMGLRSARSLPMLALLCLPFANAAITRGLDNASNLRHSVQTTLRNFLQYSSNLQRHDRACAGWLIAPVALLFAFALTQLPEIRDSAGFPATRFPVIAAERVARIPEDARLLSTDFYGGFMIYRFDGRRKVFFDGRSDFYGVDFVQAYLSMIEMRPGWQDTFEKHHFTHALLPNNYSLVTWLESRGWKKLHSDKLSTLLEKP